MLPDTVIYEYPHRIITVRDGLTRNQLFHVRQDTRGFVWLGGKRGLDRFDGLEVVSYRSDSTFSTDRVRTIEEDDEGHLWFIGTNSLFRYDGTRFYKRAKPIPLEDGMHHHGQHTYTKVDDQRTIVLRETEFSADTLLVLPQEDNNCAKKLRIKTDPKAGIYVKTSCSGVDTLSYYAPGNRWKKETILVADEIYLIPSKSPNRTPQVVVNDSLFSVNQGSLSFERKLTISSGWYSFLISTPQNLVASTQNLAGLPEAEFPVLYHKEGLAHQVDYRNEHLFIAAEEGLVVTKPASAVMRFPNERGMTANVWSMVEGAAAGAMEGKKAKFFFPLTGGSIVKMVDGRYTSIRANIGRYEEIYPGAIQRRDGSFLLPTDNRILRFDPTNSQITSVDTKERRATNDILESGNRIYAATLGLAVYENDRLVKIYGDEDGLDVTNLDFLESINEDRDGRLWLGSHNGLAVREPDGSFRNYLAGQGVPAGIVHSATDYRGNLWFATHDGISFYDYTDTLPRWVTPDFHEDVKFVHAIDSSWLLIAGVSQLYLLDLPKFYAGEINLYPFDEDDGYPVIEALQASVMQDSESIIWIGTTDGVIRLDPSKIKTYTEPTEPHFHSFSWLDESGEQEQTVVFPFSKNGEQSFTVKSTDQNIDIRFFTINHDKPHAMRFRHRLVGYRDSWTKPSPNRTMNYGELPPGNYTFELQACLYGKCTESKSLGLRVAPARFWEYLATKLFFAGLVFTVFAIAGYQLYVRRRERLRAERQAQAFELERAEARRKLTVHKVGPHFANNALTAITDLIIHGENEAARRYTSHFAELFTPVLEDELGLLWTLSEEIAFINDYLQLEELRFGEKLSYTVEIDPTLEEAADDILVPTLLAQSFVNNAVKHGVEPIERGVLSITFTQPEQDYLRVRITDNGPGFAGARPEDEGTGITAARVMVDYLNQYTETHSSITFSQPKTDETTVTLRLYLHHQLID